MAATGIGNPAGAIAVMDGGNPRSVGGTARNAIISGGVFVFASGATGVVSSGANSFVGPADILFTIDASGGQFNGIALNTSAVSGTVNVATRGEYLLACNGSVIPGTKVVCDGNNAVMSWVGNGAIGSPDIWSNLGYSIGRAMTAGASGGYALIDIHG